MTHDEYLNSFLTDARTISDERQTINARIEARERIRKKRDELLGWNGTLQTNIQTLEQRSNALRAELENAREKLAAQTELLSRICMALDISI